MARSAAIMEIDVNAASGEKRISNFLLFQSAYSEFYTTDILWPDFRKAELYEAVLEYQQRDRRFGGTIDRKA